MSSICHDFKLALRSLAKKPAFSLLVIGMLALGIAGNTAIFSIYNGLFLRPLPFPESSRLVDLDETAPKWNLQHVGISNEDFFAWREHNRTFERIGFFADGTFNLSGRGTAQRVTASRVTADLLPAFGMRPALGRNFLPEEDRPGGAKVTLIAYDFWKRQFNAGRNVLGQILQLDGVAHTVIGVLPPEAVFPQARDLWVPLAAEMPGQGYYLSGIGRLKPGVTIEQARADLTRVHRGMIQTGRKVNDITSPRLTPLRDRYMGDMKPGAVVLLGAVGVVLLIACANIAGLMMIRGATRSREIALRTALGASRFVIVRHLLAESLLLAFAGGSTGLLIGTVGLRGILASLPEQPPRWIQLGMDVRFAAFAVAITGGAALVFGLIPALNASRIDLRSCLHDASRSSLSRSRRSALSVLVVGEIALALLLLITAGLMVQAFRAVLKTDPGFRPENVLTYSVSLPQAKYPKDENRVVFIQNLVERMRALPGVTVAGAASAPPFGGHWGKMFRAEGQPPLGPKDEDPVVLEVVATPGYFDAIGVRFLSGRQFTDRDGEKSHVAIINETFAKRFFRNVNPIGKRIRYSWEQDKWMEVVGVTRDVKHYGLDQEMRASVYVTHRQNAMDGMVVVLRTAIDPKALTAPARDALRQLDPDLPMFDIAQMTERLERSVWQRKFFSMLAAVFAAIALLLAAGGIYGVISYAVTQRTPEIGIRIALGAPPARVMRQVLGHGLVMLAAGVPIGLLAMLGISRALERVLFGVSARDVLTYAMMTAGVAAMALLANLLPARRAASVDPMIALRSE